MADKIDRLFLARNCPDCALVRVMVDMDAVVSDDFRGKAGQKFNVFSALSNDAAREMLDVFGHKDKFVPLLVTADGLFLTKARQIEVHLRDNGMLKKEERK